MGFFHNFAEPIVAVSDILFCIAQNIYVTLMYDQEKQQSIFFERLDSDYFCFEHFLNG